jgi:hypothetical protein
MDGDPTVVLFEDIERTAFFHRPVTKCPDPRSLRQAIRTFSVVDQVVWPITSPITHTAGIDGFPKPPPSLMPAPSLVDTPTRLEPDSRCHPDDDDQEHKVFTAHTNEQLSRWGVGGRGGHSVSPVHSLGILARVGIALVVPQAVAWHRHHRRARLVPVLLSDR